MRKGALAVVGHIGPIPTSDGMSPLSSHLSILARSGLVRGTRDGRSIVYRADVQGIRTLVAFLITDCCDGHPEVCNLSDLLREAGRCAAAPKRNRRRR